MEAHFDIAWRGRRYRGDLFRPISIALPLKPDASSVRAWHAPPVSVRPVQVGDWVGEVAQGAPVNFANVCINPHGNATHTETLGHIAPDWRANTVLDLLPHAPLVATLRDVPANASGAGDPIVDLGSLRADPPRTPGLVLRVLGEGHVDADFSDTDPPYFDAADLAWLADLGVEHLVTDLPSVDREEDGGALAAHHAWWRYPDAPRRKATITELARLNQSLAEGLYLLHLNALPLAADASPAHPLLYALRPLQ